MEHRSNIVQFPDIRQGLSTADRETLETILHFFTSQDVSYQDCEYTPRTMREIRAEQEGTELRSNAFSFPVSRWSVTDQAESVTGQLIVVDVGHRRAFYYHGENRGGRSGSSFPSG